VPAILVAASATAEPSGGVPEVIEKM